MQRENPAVLASLPDLGVEGTEIVAELEAERTAR